MSNKNLAAAAKYIKYYPSKKYKIISIVPEERNEKIIKFFLPNDL